VKARRGWDPRGGYAGPKWVGVPQKTAKLGRGGGRSRAFFRRTGLSAFAPGSSSAGYSTKLDPVTCRQRLWSTPRHLRRALVRSARITGHGTARGPGITKFPAERFKSLARFPRGRGLTHCWTANRGDGGPLSGRRWWSLAWQDWATIPPELQDQFALGFDVRPSFPGHGNMLRGGRLLCQQQFGAPQGARKVGLVGCAAWAASSMNAKPTGGGDVSPRPCVCPRPARTRSDPARHTIRSEAQPLAVSRTSIPFAPLVRRNSIRRGHVLGRGHAAGHDVPGPESSRVHEFIGTGPPTAAVEKDDFPLRIGSGPRARSIDARNLPRPRKNWFCPGRDQTHCNFGNKPAADILDNATLSAKHFGGLPRLLDDPSSGCVLRRTV